jgi:hypothetical protein
MWSSKTRLVFVQAPELTLDTHLDFGLLALGAAHHCVKLTQDWLGEKNSINSLDSARDSSALQ